MYSVKNHRLEGPNISYHTTTKKSGKISEVAFCVIHYTASTNFDADVKTLSSSNVQASCQLVVSPSGEVAQIGLLNDCLWHAGQSSWRGYNGLNRYSIGIEVTCPGPVDMIEDYGSTALIKYWWGKTNVVDKSTLVYAPATNGGPAKWWVSFTPQQIDAVIEIGMALKKYYGIREFVGHDQIAPSRKIDPGPCCPKQVFDILNGRANDPYTEEPVDDPNSIHEARQMIVSVADSLNFRDAPNGKVIGKLPNTTPVEVFEISGNWAKVKTPAGYVGWVHKGYLV